MIESTINEYNPKEISESDITCPNCKSDPKTYASFYTVLAVIFLFFAFFFFFANYSQIAFAYKKSENISLFLEDFLGLNSKTRNDIFFDLKLNACFSFAYLICNSASLLIASVSKTLISSYLERGLSLALIILVYFSTDFEFSLEYVGFQNFSVWFSIISIILLIFLSKKKLPLQMRLFSFIPIMNFFYFFMKVFFSATYEKKISDKKFRLPITFFFGKSALKKNVEDFKLYTEKYNFDKENIAFYFKHVETSFDASKDPKLVDIFHYPEQDIFNSYILYHKAPDSDLIHTRQITNTIFPYMYLMNINYFLYINVGKFIFSAITLGLFVFLFFIYESKMNLCRLVCIYSSIFLILKIILITMFLRPFSVYCFDKLYEEMVINTEGSLYFKCFLYYKSIKEKEYFYLSPIFKYFYPGPSYRTYYEKLFEADNFFDGKIKEIFLNNYP